MNSLRELVQVVRMTRTGSFPIRNPSYSGVFQHQSPIIVQRYEFNPVIPIIVSIWILLREDFSDEFCQQACSNGQRSFRSA